MPDAIDASSQPASAAPEPDARARACLLAVLALLLLPRATRADLFHLKGGQSIEGRVLDDRGSALRIRTPLGIFDVEKELIDRRIPGQTVWDRYEARRAACHDTAAAHFELAGWCDKQGLSDERDQELAHVLQLDPNHAEARRALGYRKEAGLWVKAKPRRKRAAAKRDADPSTKDQRALQKRLANWVTNLRAIKQGKLESKGGPRGRARFEQGRELVLAIRDPLAIPAIASVLSGGSTPTRRVMVEALGRFHEDEATLNLIVAALLDPDRGVRGLAARALAPRRDPRVEQQLIEALYSDDEFILRNAATCLGVLKSRAAVEDLIAVLSTQTQREVLVTRPVFLDGIYDEYSNAVWYYTGGGFYRYTPLGIGIIGPGGFVGTQTDVEVRTVSIHRTEVQEALIAITGKNSGFDRAAWLAGWRESLHRRSSHE